MRVLIPPSASRSSIDEKSALAIGDQTASANNVPACVVQHGMQKDPSKDPSLLASIEEALDSIRPYLMADGGSVRLKSVTRDMVVELELLGACGTCPMSTMTLRAGIEQTIKRAVPAVSRVEAVATTGVA